MAVDTYGHRYDEGHAVWTCSRCGVAQVAARDHAIVCDGGPDEQRVKAQAGMVAAIEFCRAVHGGLTMEIGTAEVIEVLDFIRADCVRGGLDLDGSLAFVALRGAEKSRVFTGVSVPEFLDDLEAEIRGGAPPGPQS